VPGKTNTVSLGLWVPSSYDPRAGRPEPPVKPEMIAHQQPARQSRGHESQADPGRGRLDEARRLGDRAVESSPRHPGFAAHALHLLGDIATHPDRFDAERGEAHYRKALALAEPRSIRTLLAHCHLGLGKLYRRTEKQEQAHEHLSIADGDVSRDGHVYREMDIGFWLEKTEAEMQERNDSDETE
jgi:hypothetical protein